MVAINPARLYFFSLSLLLAFVCSKQSFAQTNFLKKRISLQSNDTELGHVLEQIEKEGGFTFSYNTARIDEKKKISVNVSETEVSEILDVIFNKDVNYKVIGSHVVLIASFQHDDPVKKRRKEYTVKGKITNAQSGAAIPNATVYAINEKSTVLTDQNGEYTLIILADQKIGGLSYSKSGYQDTIVMFSHVLEKRIDIQLVPGQKLSPLPSNSEYLKLKDLHTRKIVKSLVPRESAITGNNLTVFSRPKGQISFLPSWGTNLKMSGALTNSISLNMLAGYNGGVNGLEIGSGVNIVLHDVKGVHIAGISNFVGGNTEFLQMAGLFNKNGGNVTGVQISGFNNVVLDTIRGVQLAGFQNILHGRMQGVQISGFNNVTTQNVDGMQITGFANIAAKDVRMAQISGFFNYAKNVKGLQLSGFSNISSGTLEEGQIAGFSNYAKHVKGLQNAGLLNIASKDVDGVQMAGLFNYTKKLNGLQLGFINYADTIENGSVIGFLSFVRKGFHRVELYSNGAFDANMAVKLGTKKFYNTFRYGLNFNATHYLGYGIGAFIPLSPKVAIDASVASDLLISHSDYAGNLHQLSLGTDFNLIPEITLFLGPTINLSCIKTEDDIPVIELKDDPFYKEIHNEKLNSAWLGWHAGIAFEL
jgi:hypothetical protein